MNQFCYQNDENNYQVPYNQSGGLAIRHRESNRRLRSIENTIYQQHRTNGTLPNSTKTDRNRRERERVEKVNNEFKNLEIVLQNYFEFFSEANHNNNNKGSPCFDSHSCCFNNQDVQITKLRHYQGLSKVQTLRYAFDYIELLTQLLQMNDQNAS